MLTADLEGVSELFGKVKNAPGGTESEVLSYRSIPVRVTLYGREYAHNMPRSRVATNSAICRGKPALLGPIRGIVATIDEKSAEKEQDPPPKTWRVVYQGRERPNAWAVGSIVHDALAGWVYEPSESRSPLTAFVYQRAQAYGVVDEHAMDILQSQVWAFLDAYTTSELHQRVLHASRREHEVAYAVPTLSIGQSDHELGIVDLMFLEDDTWHIVEFKTDRLRSDESYQDLLSNPKNDYCAKLEAYTTAANRLLADSVEAYLCFLRPGPPPVVLSLDKVRQIRAGTY